ncbi:hypothetical protein V2J09_012581 [Rumex salicifolius]
MRTLCPNLDKEDGLETVLEVPIPEEMFPSTKSKWPNINMMKSWMMKPGGVGRSPSPNSSFPFADRNAQLQLLLSVIGAPLIPLPIPGSTNPSHLLKDHPIEASMAKYIIHQYIAAMGGEHALNSIDSMYAMGKVRMMASEFSAGEGAAVAAADGNGGGTGIGNNANSKVVKVKGMKHGGEIGGFVLWQKRPDLWCLELVVSGCKISAGSDGKVAWRQTPWHHSHASRGPPRPLRRSLQGLDPRLTASLFANSVCIGEKAVNNEDCFVLKLEAEASTLQARSSSNVEIIRHTIWGYFSQRTGLLVQLEDTHLLRIKASKNESIFWETTMESSISDYRTIDGVNIAHLGRTSVSLFRYGDEPDNHSRTRMEELWSIEEVDFNIKGLSNDCFLPPSDIKREDEPCTINNNNNNFNDVLVKKGAPTLTLPVKARASGPPPKISLAKIMAIDDEQVSQDKAKEGNEHEHEREQGKEDIF